MEGVEGVAIRALEKGDCDEAADAWWRSRLAAHPAVPHPVHTRDEVRRWFADVLLPDDQTWIATDADRIVAVLTLDGDDLDQLYVVPEAANRGIGSMLVDLAKALRPAGLALWTFQTNTAAREFYRRHGFTEVRRTDGAANEEQAPDVRLVWGDHAEAAG
ncbi:MAG TPA: GNAT family N-acetyltransferase [Kribbellaceae bacterium]